jgi:hypothetical protein
VCTSDSTWPAGVLPLRDFWWNDLPFETNFDQQVFYSPGTRIEFWVDGSQVPVVEKVVLLPGIGYKIYYLEVSAMTGAHTVEERLYLDGTLYMTIRVTFTFG